ncbi:MULTISPECIES: diacylglycerol/polyprenol kinase family protein [Exiguobacterium]|jgi:phytol kinase|uniref:Phosphatidate cytidylyltransferase n=1 Tax=Exiguobacterium sp. (strain ATCC BAA-1283 / AT1b) TaxID=360911 RepID=C4L0Y6_EXISA|nr:MULTISPECIES: phosphatidate cytidylyltransferase [unclassified Exiguobacterium]ACQ70949.1 phosphatidate cytidylyltransferase [Exiguobacterium sp. AT1b]QUP86917.1 phosphatidate cytidylyltransferase [Exiguobacterium sp. PFWT01]
MNEWISSILSIVVVLVFLVGLEQVGKRLGWTDETIRKSVHIAVGHWSLLAVWLMDSWYVAAVPLIFFTFANAVLLYKSPSPVHQTERKSFGTVYYPIALLIILYFFFESEPIAFLAGSLVLAWGDGMAALIGRKYGTVVYDLYGQKRSFQGSIAMFLSSYAVLFLLFLWNDVVLWQVVTYGFIISIIATLTEAISYRDWDNFTIPIIVAIATSLLL